MSQLFVKIPRDRIGALIGPKGEAKQRLEERLQVMLEIDSQTGDIAINLDKDVQDPSLLFKAKDYVLAVGRGFSPDRANKLLQDEENMLTVIDLRGNIRKVRFRHPTREKQNHRHRGQNPKNHRGTF